MTTVIYRGYWGVEAPTTARKRYAELVVGIAKDTPLVCVHLVSVIGKGQYTTRKGITYFLKSTVSGLFGKK